ncbi:hypothetical protein OUO20_18145 [Arthrobacter sp. FX8]|uniref:hypothetical protein n=1 Tax=Arthrobacter sp. FX8 TaxID=2997335 RepID=UPI00227C8BA2|nr:hypothetical protein [Arthrobacter sp. FX8]WAJ32957.1 hypothetical protein OUO20_18145 [Arthrobacter sp. FX8]
MSSSACSGLRIGNGAVREPGAELRDLPAEGLPELLEHAAREAADPPTGAELNGAPGES